jgi:hypothetical protein
LKKKLTMIGSTLPRVLVLLALIGVASPAPGQQGRELVHKIDIAAQPIDAFDPSAPALKRFGALEFRGGLVLTSAHRDFGGLSALHVAANGGDFVAVTDRGQWLRGRIVYRGAAPVAIADAAMAPMLGANGRPLKSRGWYDTESLAVDGGTFYVGIERVNQIVRFDYAKDGLIARGHALPVPPKLKELPKNQGLECLAKTPAGGPLIAISERGLDANGNIGGFLIGAVNGAFALKRSDDFDVTDCTMAPNGQLLVLERHFSWTRGVAMRIRSVPLGAIKPGATVDGVELISADKRYQIDNMEGVALHRTPDGALVLTLVSDDNFSVLQRTLLLQFKILEE